MAVNSYSSLALTIITNNATTDTVKQWSHSNAFIITSLYGFLHNSYISNIKTHL